MFREELRLARTRAGLTQEEVGSRINFSSALVGAVETGYRMPSAEFAAKCDEALDTGGFFARLRPFVARESVRLWYRAWTDVEREARLLRLWEPLLVPGLFQTEDYARELLAAWPGVTDEELAERLSLRMERQPILDRERPPEIMALFDERVLRYEVGGPDVMREQLERLHDLGRRRALSIQVVPVTAGVNPGTSGPLMLASFVDSPDVACLDTTLASELVDGPEEVFMTAILFDRIRSAALPCRASAELIEDVMAQWI